MKAIMKTIKPKACANIMNLIQSILVIKNKREANAIQKLIDKNGFAEFYVYCTKDSKKGWCMVGINKNETYYQEYDKNASYSIDRNYIGNGKVLFKFRCYKVEEITKYQSLNPLYTIPACLSANEWCEYLGEKVAYAIHISDLEIFDKPKELSEFKRCTEKTCIYGKCHKYMHCLKPLTKAPQSFVYLEVE